MLWIKKIKEHKSIKDKAVSLLNVTAGKIDGNLISDWFMPKNTPKPYWPLMHPIFSKYLKLFVKEYYKQHSNNIEIIIDNFWYQNYLKKGRHEWHTHSHTNLSAVYYLHLPYPKKQGIKIFNKKSINVKEGDLLIFPSYYLHTSKNNYNDQKKIIAFNFNLRNIR